jgi:hypothetical protein
MCYQYFADTTLLQTTEYKDFTPKIPQGRGYPAYLASHMHDSFTARFR